MSHRNDTLIQSTKREGGRIMITIPVTCVMVTCLVYIHPCVSIFCLRGHRCLENMSEWLGGREGVQAQYWLVNLTQNGWAHTHTHTYPDVGHIDLHQCYQAPVTSPEVLLVFECVCGMSMCVCVCVSYSLSLPPSLFCSHTHTHTHTRTHPSSLSQTQTDTNTPTHSHVLSYTPRLHATLVPSQ